MFFFSQIDIHIERAYWLIDTTCSVVMYFKFIIITTWKMLNADYRFTYVFFILPSLLVHCSMPKLKIKIDRCCLGYFSLCREAGSGDKSVAYQTSALTDEYLQTSICSSNRNKPVRKEEDDKMQRKWLLLHGECLGLFKESSEEIFPEGPRFFFSFLYLFSWTGKLFSVLFINLLQQHVENNYWFRTSIAMATWI